MKLPKAKTYDTPIKPIKEDRYNLLNKNINKSKAVELIKEDIRKRIKKSGPLQVAVNMWKDKQYTTDFVIVQKGKDVDKIQFDEEFMIDYDEESGLRDDEIISYMSLFYAKADNNVGDDDDTNDCLYNALCQAFTYKKPKLLQSAEILKKIY